MVEHGFKCVICTTWQSNEERVDVAYYSNNSPEDEEFCKKCWSKMRYG